ncbi:hypothetical protein [Brevibacterium yomogidense]|uniref:hypothetical protein n=1 Tax=Brevibacterium yomogidense TaxID=946573 RepID=UPI0018DF0BCF|nr:hypothetical protein [Brevibacterium yomogidense]
MTFSPQQARVGAPAPTLAWPTRIDETRALAWLRKRQSGIEDARAQLYHHPMLAAAYEVRKRDESATAHAIVDLVGGRAYGAEPWDHITFVPIAEAKATARATNGATHAGGAGASGTVGSESPAAGTVTDPVRVLDDARAERAARDLVRSFLLRGRRLGAPGKLHPLREPFLFGKPNWWLTGTREDKPVEIILDGLTGRHYALRA